MLKEKGKDGMEKGRRKRRGLGERLIEIVRWVGVITLPIPTALILGAIMMKMIGIKGEETGWKGIAAIVVTIIQGIIIMTGAYTIAPRAKKETRWLIELNYIIGGGAILVNEYLKNGKLSWEGMIRIGVPVGVCIAGKAIGIMERRKKKGEGSGCKVNNSSWSNKGKEESQ